MKAVARDYRYSVFGLNVRSEIALPELARGDPDRPVDVEITLGVIAVEQSGPGYHYLDDAVLLVIPGTGRYLMRGGKSVVVEPSSGAPDRNVRLYLLGSALAAILHQRGRLPLHANAIDLSGRAVAFIGESGAGKSTMAAWFHDRGKRVLADDVAVVELDGRGQAMVHPGIPRLRLWQDSLETSGRRAQDFERSYFDQSPREKFDVPVIGDGSLEPIPLVAIYQLERGETLRIEPVSGAEAAGIVFANTYRGIVVGETGGARAHFELATALVNQVPVYRLVRPWDLAMLGQVGQSVIDQHPS